MCDRCEYKVKCINVIDVNIRVNEKYFISLKKRVKLMCLTCVKIRVNEHI